MLERQGVEPAVAQQLLDDPWSVLPRAPQRYTLLAEQAGFVADLDALTIGNVLCEAGAGRSKQSEDVDHGVGIQIHKHIGSPVEVDDVIMTLDGPFGIDMQLIQRMKNSITISDYQVAVSSRILETVTISIVRRLELMEAIIKEMLVANIADLA